MENKTIIVNSFKDKLCILGYKALDLGKSVLNSPLTYLCAAGLVGYKISDNVMKNDYSATAKIGHTEITLTKNQSDKS